jgi:hypothetical protein
MNYGFLRGVYAAVADRDLDKVATLFEPEAYGRVLGRSRIADDYHGPRGVSEIFERMLSLSGGTLRYDVEDLQANEHHGLALVRAHAAREGRTREAAELHLFHRYEQPHGPVLTYWIQPFDHYLFDEFWS